MFLRQHPAPRLSGSHRDTRPPPPPPFPEPQPEPVRVPLVQRAGSRALRQRDADQARPERRVYPLFQLANRAQ